MNKFFASLLAAMIFFSDIEAMTKYTLIADAKKVEVTQIAAQETVVLNGMIAAKKIHIDCKSFNGINFLAPLSIAGTMTEQQILKALEKTFGALTVIHVEHLPA